MRERENFRLSNGFLLWFAFILSLCGLSTALKQYYAEDICHRKSDHGIVTGYPSIDLSRQNSVILKSFGNDILPNCEIAVKPEMFASVLLSIRSYNLTSSDELIIEDSDLFKLQLLDKKEFSDERKTISSDGRMYIRFTPDNSTPRWKNNFEFVLTQIHDGPCRRGQFKCSNGRCIDSSLTCDGHNHCGDRSDQTNCGRKNDGRTGEFEEHIERRTNGWIITIIVVAAIFVIVFIAVVAVVIRRAVKKKDGKAGSGAPVPTVTAQPPTAPQPDHTYWTRIRNSLRRNPQAAPESIPGSQDQHTSDNYHAVPSMYPQIKDAPMVPGHTGVDNPDFKHDE